MPTIQPIKSTGAVTGTQTLDVPNGYNYYRVTIESASAQTYTNKCLVQDGARYTTFDSNTMVGMSLQHSTYHTQKDSNLSRQVQTNTLQLLQE